MSSKSRETKFCEKISLRIRRKRNKTEVYHWLSKEYLCLKCLSLTTSMFSTVNRQFNSEADPHLRSSLRSVKPEHKVPLNFCFQEIREILNVMAKRDPLQLLYWGRERERERHHRCSTQETEHPEHHFMSVWICACMCVLSACWRMTGSTKSWAASQFPPINLWAHYQNTEFLLSCLEAREASQ